MTTGAALTARDGLPPDAGLPLPAGALPAAVDRAARPAAAIPDLLSPAAPPEGPAVPPEGTAAAPGGPAAAPGDPAAAPAPVAGLTAEERAARDGLPPPARNLPPLPDTDASTWDVAVAAWQRDTILTDAWNDKARRRRALSLEMERLLPPDLRDGMWRNYQFSGSEDWRGVDQLVIETAAAAAASDPALAAALAGYPLTIEAFNARIDAERQADVDEADVVLNQPGGAIAEFIGASARALTDEISLMLLPFGVSGRAWRVITGEALLGAAGEAAILPREFEVARELDLPDPDALGRIALGGLAGGGIAGGIIGLGRGASALMTRAEARRAGLVETRPEGVPFHAHEAAVDAAEGALRGDQTVQEQLQLPPEPSARTATGLPVPGPDAPLAWAAIRNGIFAGESGGDYDALFGYTNRQGGPFANVKVTEMTVDEAIAFSDPAGPYAQWVKGQIGRVATPMGAYQIVGTTLRDARRALGLRGDEVMTPELQERLGQWVYRTQGTGAWTGYRGPVSDYTPAAGGSYIPTSRGYTGTGQVTAGDDFRIDVDYQVVDAASLLRASGDLQPRDRSRIASDAWIADTAARLDPALLMPAPTADRGPPIVGPDDVIESGNGRFGAIVRAHAEHPDRAAAYRAQIEAAGFAIPEGVEQPVLIARRKTDLSPEDRRRLTVAAQDSGVAVLTPTEAAAASSRAMTAPVLARLDPSVPLRAEGNGDFVRAALAALPRSARNAMFDGDGMLNSFGERQLREALFARAWPDPDILARFAETDAGELKGLLTALDRAAPAWAALKADIEAGLVRPEMDIGDFVLDAVRLIGAARDLAATGKTPVARAVQDLLTDVDLLDGALSPLTVALVRRFWRNGRAAPADDVAAFLTRYAGDARKAGATGGMFGAPGPREVLAAIDRATFGDLPEDLGRARGFARPGQDAPPADAAPEGFDQGAASPEAEAVDAEILAELTSGDGPFGPVFREENGDPEAAIRRLMHERRGEVPDAFRHPDAPDDPVALVYGNEKFGLRHIQSKHPDQFARLPELLRGGRLVEDAEGLPRRYIVNDAEPADVAVIRLDWDGQQKSWLVTTYPADYGRFARGQKEANRSGPGEARVPASTGPAKDSPDAGETQPGGASGEKRAGRAATTDTDPSKARDDTAGQGTGTQADIGRTAPSDQGPDPIAADLAAARAELGDAFDDMTVEMPDGTKASLRAILRETLDDLEADRAADAALDACFLNPAATFGPKGPAS